MKTLFLILSIYLSLFITSTKCYSQNDSILPNYEGAYSLLEMSFDWNFNWVYTPKYVSFYNNDEDDTIEVEIDPIAKIFMDGYRAYIIGTEYPTGMHIYTDSAVVLYDFSLIIGDTAYYEDNSGASTQDSPVTVENIDYETIQGEQHKRMILSNGDVWIQGIGSTVHPLWPVMSHFEINYIFCSANLFYFNQGNYHDLQFEEQDCSWYYEIGLSELDKTHKNIIKTVDLLGRVINNEPNIFMINVYDDGSAEKIFRIE